MNDFYDDFFKDDKLDIRNYVIDFAHLIKQETATQNSTSKVYSISAEFGIGKTFFCDKLELVLNHDKVPVSKLNIWRMDFYENPLIPILINLQNTYIKNNKFQVWISNTLKFGTNLTSWLIKNILKYYGFNIAKLTKIYKQFKPAKSNIYNSYIEYEKQLNKTKKFLSSWAEKINKPIVIIIDELDRCRPDYSVKTLEVLKHFFDIPGFIFILALDEEQLKNSVKTLFGTQNFDGYKRKFINNSFILPKPDKVKFTKYLYEKSNFQQIVNNIKENSKDLVFKIRRDNYRDMIDANFMGKDNHKEIQEAKQYNELQTIDSIIQRYFAAYSMWFKFTPRHMEQAFDRLILFTKSVASSNILYSPDLAVFLACLHEFDIKIYELLRKSPPFSGLYGGILNKIYIRGDKHCFAYQIYKEDAIEKFGKLDRNITPIVPEVNDFSCISNGTTSNIYIHDNLDRFFTEQEDLKWIIDINNCGQKSVIDNNTRIGIIINSKREEKWQEPKPDINTASNFDLDSFRKSYFDKMDFISNFS